jgi:hypothetical protein
MLVRYTIVNICFKVNSFNYSQIIIIISITINDRGVLAVLQEEQGCCLAKLVLEAGKLYPVGIPYRSQMGYVRR